jgi:hypothetical protein
MLRRVFTRMFFVGGPMEHQHRKDSLVLIARSLLETIFGNVWGICTLCQIMWTGCPCLASMLACFLLTVTQQSSCLYGGTTRYHIDCCVTMYNEKALNPVQTWLPGFSAMCRYTTIDMASLPASSTLDKREGMRSLISSIERDEIKAVFLMSEYTFYRDAAAIADLRFFTMLCRQHGVFVITPQVVYDFADPASARLFLFAIEATSFAISTRIGRKTTHNKRNQA